MCFKTIDPKILTTIYNCARYNKRLFRARYATYKLGKLSEFKLFFLLLYYITFFYYSNIIISI